MEPVDVRRRLTCYDLITLVAEGSAERDGQRRGQPNRVLVARIETENRLSKLQLSGKDIRLVGNSRIVRIPENSIGTRRTRSGEAGTERSVERVLEIVLEPVVSASAAEVVRPPREESTNAAGPGEIKNIGRELGEESVRINLRPVALARGRPE